ncbi:hypothetical protein Pan44_03650 [Caulifigura coniformis]|uniref:Uncharacterized protein n=1 Tax=Caulifigura coniformis TaxID=2527983 RepID=A0A517S8A4_9PLAN|nr:hypothetical protein [Caulifigura coniformis]QDT52355.1 hypothetical protein Pan44_03650 [Caulifigura coniformis]
MTPPPSDTPDPIDDLVGDYLRRVAGQTDAGPLLERIEADRRLTLSATESPRASSSRSLSRSAAWGLIAAVMLVAFLGGRYFDTSSVQAATLLKNVRTVHRRSVDRCYLVQHAPESRSGGQPPSEGSESLLWTRGDHFWSDAVVGSSRIKIGRDASGTIWLSSSPQKGIRFQANSSAIPRELTTLCQISSLTVPVLVDEVLTDFDINTDGPSDRPDGRRSVIWARLKNGRSHSFLSAAMLEVDVERNLLVRLVLWLHQPKGPGGTVTYTLIDRPAPGLQSYRLESHLDADAVIEDKSFKSSK